MPRLFLSLFLAAVLISPFAPSAKGEGVVQTNAATSIPAVTNVAAAPTNAPVPAPLVDQGRVLKVGITERIPYSSKNELGEWHGIGVDLWEEVAKKLGIKFQYEECLMSEMHQKLKDHEIDMILVTGQSADYLGVEDFTQPYVYSHGSVVIGHLSVLSALENVINHLVQSGMFLIVLTMFGAMILISLVLVYFEGRHGGGHFEGPLLNRFANALWFTAFNMTSVGYGDSSRLSHIGRTITFLWMLLGVLFIALFTGSVVSSLTTAEINSSVVRLEDLSHYRCGVFAGAKIEKVLLAKGIPARKYPTLMEGFGGLQRGQISAFAVDAISANTIVNQEYPGQFKICVMPSVQLLYSFDFRKGDPLYDPVNDEVIRATLHPDWRSRMERWSGPIPF